MASHVARKDQRHAARTRHAGSATNLPTAASTATTSSAAAATNFCRFSMERLPPLITDTVAWQTTHALQRAALLAAPARSLVGDGVVAPMSRCRAWVREGAVSASPALSLSLSLPSDP